MRKDESRLQAFSKVIRMKHPIPIIMSKRSSRELLVLFSATKGGRCWFILCPDAISAEPSCLSACLSFRASPIRSDKSRKTFRSTSNGEVGVFFFFFFIYLLFFFRKNLYFVFHIPIELKCYYNKRLHIPTPQTHVAFAQQCSGPGIIRSASQTASVIQG